MFDKTILRNIAITKQSNININNIVTNRSKTSYSSKIYSKKKYHQKKVMNEMRNLKEDSKKSQKKLKVRTIFNRDDLKRIVNNVIDQEKNRTMNSHDLFN